MATVMKETLQESTCIFGEVQGVEAALTIQQIVQAVESSYLSALLGIEPPSTPCLSGTVYQILEHLHAMCCYKLRPCVATNA
jgi:hypothetical protein